MDARAGGSRDRGTTSRQATTWVVSRHLLVAQAVSAALTSVGMRVRAVPWEAVGWDLDSPLAPPRLETDVVVVLDDADDPTSIDAIKELVRSADARVLVATSHPPDYYWGALISSAHVADVGLATSVGQLAELVARFEAGEPVLDPDIREALAHEWYVELEMQRKLAALVGTLSPRERLVLELLALGRRVPEIGRALELSESTVRSHVKSLRSKLGAETQLAAVAMFVRFKNSGILLQLVPRPRTG